MLLISVLLGAAFTGSVHAGHCPKDAAAIKHALENSSIGMAEKQEIQALTEKGMALHTAGDHRESEKVLADAMRKVLMSK
jgi:replicative superfamily II helicase